MILPCVDCLKLPFCSEKEILDLLPECKQLKSFIRTRKGLTSIIKYEDNEFKTTLQVKTSLPYIYIEPLI